MEQMEDRSISVRSSREEIIAVDRAHATTKVWKGKKIVGFSRWMGWDNLWHAVLVLDDHTRYTMFEDPSPRRRPAQKDEKALLEKAWSAFDWSVMTKPTRF